jgi:GNAT superfamily N-acetyltransferase
MVLRRVRLAALRDAPSAFGSTYDREADRSEQEWSNWARLGASSADRALFFAVDDDDVVGLAGGHRDDTASLEVHLVSMWTSPAVRRRGVGQALARSVLEWAGTVGAETVGLWVTRGNESAQALYESIGFEPTGEDQPLPSDPCKDEIRMVLRLAASGTVEVSKQAHL